MPLHSTLYYQCSVILFYLTILPSDIVGASWLRRRPPCHPNECLRCSQDRRRKLRRITFSAATKSVLCCLSTLFQNFAPYCIRTSALSFPFRGLEHCRPNDQCLILPEHVARPLPLSSPLQKNTIQIPLNGTRGYNGQWYLNGI